jgi:RNA polymerase sigma-70 factor (ECF subfamily)
LDREAETLNDRPSPDREDFGGLSARVYRLCLAMLGSDADASEAAQEALARAWSRRREKRANVSWWTWAGGFAVRVCRETRRDRRLSALRQAPDEAMPARPGPRLEPLTPRHAALHHAILALPDRQREVTVLRFLMGLSTRQTARMLGCPEGTVKSNLHKAILNLKATLETRGSSHELHRI